MKKHRGFLALLADGMIAAAGMQVSAEEAGTAGIEIMNETGSAPDDGQGEIRRVAEGGIFSADIVLENVSPAAALAVSDITVTPACAEVIGMEWLLTEEGVISDIDPETGGAVVAYDEAADLNGAVMRLTLKADKVEKDTVCEILCTVVLEIDGVRTEAAVTPGIVEIYDFLPGDVNGDNTVTSADTVYLLRYTLLPERYPLHGTGFDYSGDGKVDADDAVYLLYHALMPEKYPIKD